MKPSLIASYLTFFFFKKSLFFAILSIKNSTEMYWWLKIEREVWDRLIGVQLTSICTHILLVQLLNWGNILKSSLLINTSSRHGNTDSSILLPLAHPPLLSSLQCR